MDVNEWQDRNALSLISVQFGKSMDGSAEQRANAKWATYSHNGKLTDVNPQLTNAQ